MRHLVIRNLGPLREAARWEYKRPKVSYEYDEASNTDTVITPTGQRLRLISSSSGLQSLIPMLVHLDYVFEGQYRDGGRGIYKPRGEPSWLGLSRGALMVGKANHSPSDETVQRISGVQRGHQSGGLSAGWLP